MELLKSLQRLNLYSNKTPQSKTINTKMVNEYSLNIKPIEAKYKIEPKHISLLMFVVCTRTSTKKS